MEKSTFIGLILGFLAIGVGMVIKGAELSAIINPGALLIIFGGTAASLFMAFPMSEIKKFPVLIKIVFSKPSHVPKRELIDWFIQWAGVARKEGLLALESRMEEIDDQFLKNGMRMIIDGNDPEFVRDVLLEEIAVTEDRHRTGALIFSQAGTYAPTLGVLGAVVGLIAALGNLDNIAVLGESIAAAFVATLLGIFTGYVLWNPIANKLKRLSQQEIEIKQIMAEGLLSIQSGISTFALEQKLLVYLSPKEQKAAEETAEEEVNREQQAQTT